MNKARLLWGKLSLVTVLSLGFMVLGIGCISWAMFSMWVDSDYSADATRIPMKHFRPGLLRRALMWNQIPFTLYILRRVTILEV